MVIPSFIPVQVVIVLIILGVSLPIAWALLRWGFGPAGSKRFLQFLGIPLLGFLLIVLLNYLLMEILGERLFEWYLGTLLVLGILGLWIWVLFARANLIARAGKIHWNLSSAICNPSTVLGIVMLGLAGFIFLSIMSEPDRTLLKALHCGFYFSLGLYQWIVNGSGPQITEKGLLIYLTLFPWAEITAYHWIGNETGYSMLFFDRPLVSGKRERPEVQKLKMKIPNRHRAAVEALLREYLAPDAGQAG